VHGRVLNARLDRWRRRRAQGLPEHPIERHADERHDGRAKPIDLLLEHTPAFEVLRGTKIVDPRARPRDHVRHSQPPLRQPHIIFERDWHRHQARFVQQLPEAIRWAGEVMSCLRRSDARIDSDEQHAHARLDAIREPQSAPFLSSRCRPIFHLKYDPCAGSQVPKMGVRLARPPSTLAATP
jgi:hypothetical protein